MTFLRELSQGYHVTYLSAILEIHTQGTVLSLGSLRLWDSRIIGVVLSFQAFYHMMSALGPWCPCRLLHKRKYLCRRVSMLGLGHSFIKWTVKMYVC